MKRSDLIIRTKYACAALLLLCFFLPMSKCTHYTHPTSKSSGIPPAQDSTAVVKEVIYTYPLSDFDVRQPWSWLCLLALIWPLPVLVCQRVGKRRFVLATVAVMEPILCGPSFYYIYLLSGLGQRLIGGYIALIAYAAYFAASVFGLGTLIAKRYGLHRT